MPDFDLLQDLTSEEPTRSANESVPRAAFFLPVGEDDRAEIESLPVIFLVVSLFVPETLVLEQIRTVCLL